MKLSLRKKLLLLFTSKGESLSEEILDFITRVEDDGGVVESPKCIGVLDADFVMYPAGYKPTKVYSQRPVEVLGAELVVNGGFDTDLSGWAINGQASLSWSDGIALVDVTGSAGGIRDSQVFNLIIGKIYLVTADTRFITFNGTLGADIGFGAEQILTQDGRFHFNFIAQSTNPLIAFTRTTPNIGTFTIDNVSIKEVLVGDGDFTMERNCTKYRTNKLGLLEEMGFNVLAPDYADGECGVNVHEPESTNLVNWSEDFENASSTFDTSFISKNNIAPNGELTAYLCESLGTPRISYVNIPLEIGKEYTFSVWCKNLDATSINFFFYDGVVQLLYDFVGDINTNEYVRVSHTFTATNTTTIGQLQVFRNVNTGGKAFLWGFQVEQSSYPTSYIKTQGATVTRFKDIVKDAGDVNSFNSEEGVLYVECARDSNDGANGGFSINDGTNDNAIRLFFNQVDTVSVITAITGVNEVIKTAIPITSSTVMNKFAVMWKLNDYQIWYNGVKIAFDTSAQVYPLGTLNNINMDNNGIPFNGKVKALKVFKTALTSQQLLELTTDGFITTP